MLELKDVDAGYGPIRVLFGVSLRVEEGEVVCLLGRNGVGKTTTLRTIVGQVRPTAGKVLFDGADIGGMEPWRIARLGVAYVPADRRCFGALTVEENLEVGTQPVRDGEAWTVERVYDLFPDLARLRKMKSAYLSGGQQQMLTMGRALMGNPRVLLLDEPAEGLAPVILENIEAQVRTLTQEGLTILLAEMNVGFALKLSSRVYILEKGEIRFEGTTDELEAREDLMHEHLAV